ncbi:RNA polymerase sigma factor SigZ [Flagellimonas sp. 2504JD4-2]
MEDTLVHYYKPLLGYINKRVNNTLDAEDLLQDIFLKLSQSDLEKIDNLKSWLYAVARNAIIDYYRKKKIELIELEQQFSAESMDDASTVYELSKCVQTFIEYLPEDYAQLLKLHEIEGLPQKEIAERLDMNYVTVRSKIQRGRVKLKQLFAECCQVEQGGRGAILCYNNKSSCC